MTTLIEEDITLPDVDKTRTDQTSYVQQLTDKKPSDETLAISNFEYALQLIEELKATLLQSTEINASKILQIKEEIAAGNYQINSQAIAEKLIELTELNAKEEPEIA